MVTIQTSKSNFDKVAEWVGHLLGKEINYKEIEVKES
jgi:hypothetical protein